MKLKKEKKFFEKKGRKKFLKKDKLYKHVKIVWGEGMRVKLYI